MRILTVDIGTGTQDIFLFDSRLSVENGYKLVMPSPTLMISQRIRRATDLAQPILLSGLTMGGGPSSWAVDAHLKAGLPVYALPEAAATINDDLQAVAELGVRLVTQEEAARLPDDVQRVEFCDFDFSSIQTAFASFGVSLDDLDALAVAVFDHGAAPAGFSDRQFRFDYLDAQLRAENRLSAFAFRAEHIPASMTRLHAVARSASSLPFPLLVMDTAPAAVLGALYDPLAAAQTNCIVVNVGNFHTLAFRLDFGRVTGLFEHHTGLLDQPALENLLLRLAEGSLTHAEVFGSNGHGALCLANQPLDLIHAPSRLIVTGPRRALLQDSHLRPHFAAPFGDMMISGCFGLLAACADHFPEFQDELHRALQPARKVSTAPWDI